MKKFEAEAQRLADMLKDEEGMNERMKVLKQLNNNFLINFSNTL